MNTKKGQVSIELFTTFGMVLAFTLPVLLLLLTITQYGHENAATAQADATVRILAENIDFIYLQGNGAKKTLLLNFPSNAKSLMIDKVGHEIVINLTISAGYYEAATPFYGEVFTDYTLTNTSGLLAVTLENTDGKVKISYAQ